MYSGQRGSRPRCCQELTCSRHCSQTKYRQQGFDRLLACLQELACSLNRSNSGIPLHILAVGGDLSPGVEQRASQLGTFIFVEDLRHENYKHDGRYTLNWLKLRAWELQEWDAIVLLDADVTVLGDLTHIFRLPTDFAAVLDNGKTVHRYSGMGSIQAGVIMLRPCTQLAQHMQDVVAGNKLLQSPYSNAEQDFLNWYFKYTAWLLPLSYNAYADRLEPDMTPGGESPLIVHHTVHKPFPQAVKAKTSYPGHRFLCSG
eukprot:jgi/Astpho2/7498/Aster-x0323